MVLPGPTAAARGGAVLGPASAPYLHPRLSQAAALRAAKEEFVANLPGTTHWEVFCVLSSLPLCLLVAAYVEARVSARVRSGGRRLLSRVLPGRLLALLSRRSPLPKFVYEFCGGVLPLLLLLMSVAPAEPAFLLLFLCWGSTALKLWMRTAHGPGARQHMAHMLAHLAAPRKRFVSAFRGGLMAATCLAILGVDFRAFPRRYAKAEGYGGGVMDVGVGAIIFAGGLVSAAATAAAGGAPAAGPAAAASGGSARGRPGAGGGSSSSSCAAASLSLAAAWLLRLARGVRAALPLLLLGGARQLATSVVGYQAHVGEYGLHWNFFYTIAAVALLTLALPAPPRWLALLALALSAGHQALLRVDAAQLAASLAALLGLRGGAGGAASAAAGATGAGGPCSSGCLQQQLASMFPGLLHGCGAGSAMNSSSSSVGGDGGADAATTAAAGAAAGAAAAGGSVAVASSVGAWLQAELPVGVRQAAGFLAANKEGLGSLPGYWALHLLGAAVGHHLATSCAATAASARAALLSGAAHERGGGGSGHHGTGGAGAGGAAAVAECGRRVWAWVGAWWVVDLLLWAALAAVEAGVEPVSRRACNLPYVLWTAAQCLAWLLLVLMAELLTAVICSTSGGCAISGTSVMAVAALQQGGGATAPAASSSGGLLAASSSSGGRGPVRRSLDAAMAAAGLQGLAGGGAAHSHGTSTAGGAGATGAPSPAATASSSAAQQSLPGGGGSAASSSPSSARHRRANARRAGGGGNMAAAAAAAAALTAATVGGGPGLAGASATAAMAATGVVDASGDAGSAGGGSSRESSPRKPPQQAARGAAQAGASPRAGAASLLRNGSSTHHHQQQQHQQQQQQGAGGTPGRTGGRSSSRHAATSRLQQQQQLQDGSGSPLHPEAAAGAAASSPPSGSGASGGPLRLMLAFNRNMLALFLAANLLTGAVNLCLNTLEVAPWPSRVIVGVYMLVLCSLAVALDSAGITLKPW